jgi:hypothetical protein
MIFMQDDFLLLYTDIFLRQRSVEIFAVYGVPVPVVPK